jgi:GAF domain-containing protein
MLLLESKTEHPMNTTIFPLGKTIQDIVYYDMPDPGTDQDFNALAELAAFSCNCPVAIISFTPIQKQWIHTKEISLSGLTPIHDVFYTTALCQGEVMVITDVANDERFAVAPSTANYSGIHFYAGTPVISTSGNLLGSVFVLDTEARGEFSSEHKAVLKSIAQLALRLLELNVANRLVVKQAGEMLEEEKKMTRLVISEQEAEKGFIAHKLQENFAQTLAASKCISNLLNTQSTPKIISFIKEWKTFPV